MNFLLAFVVPWAVILIPPVFFRWWDQEPLSVRAAFFTTLALFFFNHVLFAWITGAATGRPILVLGAVASFWVLRWKGKSRPAAHVEPAVPPQ